MKITIFWDLTLCCHFTGTSCYQATQYHIPDDNSLHSHQHKNNSPVLNATSSLSLFLTYALPAILYCSFLYHFTKSRIAVFHFFSYPFFTSIASLGFHFFLNCSPSILLYLYFRCHGMLTLFSSGINNVKSSITAARGSQIFFTL